MKKMFKKLFLFLFFALTLLGLLNLFVYLQSKPFLLPANSPMSFPAAIVPGAGLNKDKTPSLALKDRLDGALRFYEAGKVQKILVSGDNRFEYYDEPSSMRRYLVSMGIPDSDIISDFAGRRTYDTCYRAKVIFGLEKLVIFTQAYHLPRAVYLCRALGLDAYGIAVEESDYIPSRYRFWIFREVFARAAAFWDIHMAKPVPVLGEPEPIFQSP
ncbi:MAG: ElyC/SanA/YdcF family protein [Anaerolineaceae bacterium]|nr:ElyC/SanA/YdcF family protein [Anaerolineaceae bacterium]